MIRVPTYVRQIGYRFVKSCVCCLDAMHFHYALRQEALQQMQGMRETSIALNKFSYTAALSACEKGYTAACLRWLLHRGS